MTAKPKKFIWIITNRMGEITHATTTVKKARQQGRANDQLKPEDGPSTIYMYGDLKSSETIGLRYTQKVHNHIADAHRSRQTLVPTMCRNCKKVALVNETSRVSSNQICGACLRASIS